MTFKNQKVPTRPKLSAIIRVYIKYNTKYLV